RPKRAALPPEPTRLFVPAHPESVSIQSEPAPLIVPGRSVVPDSLIRTRAKFAREQLALAQQMEQSGNVSVASIAYANAVRADSPLQAANAGLGRLFMRISRPKDAEPYLRRALRLDPRDFDSERELGLALSALHRHAEALEHLRRLTMREPTRDE